MFLGGSGPALRSAQFLCLDGHRSFPHLLVGLRGFQSLPKGLCVEPGRLR